MNFPTFNTKSAYKTHPNKLLLRKYLVSKIFPVLKCQLFYIIWIYVQILLYTFYTHMF